MPSPFTFTPGTAGKAYIDMHYADEVVENFISEDTEKYVYKILGLRGSGKSVIYSKILSALKQQDKWLVYTLSSGGDPMQTLIGLMSREKFIDSTETVTSVKTEGNIEGNLMLIKGTGTFAAQRESRPNDNFYSQEAALKEMVQNASAKGYRIAIGIDDISKTDNMVRFLSLVGDMILDESKNIYLICTGLTRNIDDFVSEPHLSFFVRSDKIEIRTLSIPLITFKYQELLGAPQPEAKALAEFTKGYAYAYQVLGELCYKHRTTSIEAVQDEFNSLMASQYDLIWNSLTPAEQALLKIIVHTPSGSVPEIKAQMKNRNSFDVLRSRLIKKHIIVPNGYAAVTTELPQFREYIDMWTS